MDLDAMIRGGYENRFSNAARMYRRSGSVSALRRSGRRGTLRAAFHFEAPRDHLQQEESSQPQQARAEDDQAFRFPRPCRLEREFRPCFRLPGLADQVFVHQPLADDLRDRKVESIPVSHVSPIVIPERLLVDVPKQVKWLDGNVGTLETPFQETPEVLKAVSVNLSVNICLSMVDDLVRELLIQTPIGDQFVSVDIRSLADVLLNDGLKGLYRPVLNYGRSNFAAALEHSHHDGLFERVVFPLGSVHVAGLTANEGLVYFDVTGQFAASFALMRLSDPVEHEPRGLLTDSERPVKLPGRDTILGVGEEPHSREPFVQRERRVFKDGSGLDRELTFGVMATALPALMLRHETDTLTSTGRADNAFRPALRCEVVQAVVRIGVIDDGFLKSGGRLAFHALSVPEKHGLVKFIIAEVFIEHI